MSEDPAEYRATAAHDLIVEARLATMLSIQDAMNVIVHPQWRDQRFAWSRAIWMETCELMEHTAWRWWKAPPAPADEQQRIELVDIWHFLLSWALQLQWTPAQVLRHWPRPDSQLGDKPEPQGGAAVSDIESLARYALAGDLAGALGAFDALCVVYGLSEERLFRLYVGKNQLNRLRQAHGYKKGTYRKHWNGQEDNEVLERLMSAMEAVPDTDFPSALYQQLEAAYRAAAPGGEPVR